MSQLCKYMHHPLFYFFCRFFFHWGHCSVLSRVTCAMQQVRISFIFYISVCVHAKLLQLCRPCDPMDCGPPGSSVHGISQARILECVAMPSSRGSSRPRDRTHVMHLLHWQADSSPLAPLGKPPVYMWWCVYVKPNPPVYLSSSYPLVTCLFSTSVTLLLFYKWVHLFFLPHISNTIRYLSFCVWLASLSMTISFDCFFLLFTWWPLFLLLFHV